MNSIPANRIGQCLIEQGYLDERALAQALSAQNEAPGDRIGAICVRLGLISEHNLLKTLSLQLGIPIFDPDQHSAKLAAARLFHEGEKINLSLAQRMAFFAWDEEAQICVVARDPLDSSLNEWLDVRWARGRKCRFILAAARDLERMLSEIYRPANSGSGLLAQDLRRLAEDAPVVELVNGVLARANDYNSSDVHIEPHEDGFAVRYRVDGRLQAAENYPRERFDAVVSRIKLIAALDISERRLPQDGRFSSRAAGVDIDIRVSVIPGVFGESLVMRLLPSSENKRFVLENLGFEPDHLAMFRDWLSQPDGIILVTGPTGSGKSTTLYSALADCDLAGERILTVEDPVEYHVEGVTQFQVHADIGFTFPAALRALLRHDPDTIMIGEIRDSETAGIAVQASLTGHRVFSTLHTNDSATAFLRLSNMGVEPFLVGATVRGVIAQRLVRRLCKHCSRLAHSDDLLPEAARRSLVASGIAENEWTFRHPVGCEYCNGTGYRGRVAIYEMLPATERLRSVLTQPEASHLDLLRAIEGQFRFLRDDGLIKAARGITSVEEVFLITGSGVAAELSSGVL